MPNWCYTKIIFHGSKDEIVDFHEKIDKWSEEELIPNGFGPDWLGNILHRVGLGNRIDVDENRIRCRGQITYVEEPEINSDDDATFYIDVETAWCPMLIMWVETIKALNYKTIGFSYLAEEMGMGLYEIYDPYGDFPESYYVDTWLCGEDENNEKLCALQDNIYHSSDEELIATLQELLETDEKELSILIEKAEHYPFKDDSSYIFIYEYVRVTEIVD